MILITTDSVQDKNITECLRLVLIVVAVIVAGTNCFLIGTAVKLG